MSYTSGDRGHSFVGAGTLNASAGSTSVLVAAHGNTVAQDLIVLVVYGAGDLTIATDAGEGWVLLDGGWDSTNTFSLAMFACVSARIGATRTGLTLMSSFAWTAQNASYRPLYGLRWDLANFVRSAGWQNAAASSTSLIRPAFAGAGRAANVAQGIVLTAGGYNNAAVTTTCGNITNFTERFDTGQIAPPHGVVLNEKSTITGIDHFSTLAATLGAAKTNRAGVRAYVPMFARTMQRSRLTARRMMG